MEIEISSVGGVSPDSPLGGALMGTKVGEGRRRSRPPRLLARHGRLDPRFLSAVGGAQPSSGANRLISLPSGSTTYA